MSLPQIGYQGSKRQRTTMSEPNPSLDTLPTDVLRRVWSFFVTFTPLQSSKVEDQIVDLQSVASTRLICKSFHDAFDSHRVWLLCAKALKAECVAKRKQGNNLEYALGEAHPRGAGPLVFETQGDALEFHQELVDRINALKRRTDRISNVLLPGANRLVTAQGDEPVTFSLG